jgi:nucleobase:cation symporter-1, NCS1 family
MRRARRGRWVSDVPARLEAESWRTPSTLRPSRAPPLDCRPLQVKTNGINVISGTERKGRPRDLFWPWFAANVSVLGLSYASFVLGFGISFWQALCVGIVEIVVSFLLCGFIAVAGKRGSAPTRC